MNARTYFSFRSCRQRIARLKGLSLEQQENIDCMRQEIVCMNEESVGHKSQLECSGKLENMLEAVMDKMMNEELEKTLFLIMHGNLVKKT